MHKSKKRQANTMKYISKKELAERAGVSKRTFGRWMARHDEELRLGVEKWHKLVSPVAARQIAEWYGIDL